MDNAVKTALEGVGIDVQEALDRFMGNEALMMRFLTRFPQDLNFSALRKAVDAGDAAQAFTAAHTLKGVVGNLSIHSLFHPVSAMVEDLRRGDLSSASQQMGALEAQYLQVVSALEQLQ